MSDSQSFSRRTASMRRQIRGVITRTTISSVTDTTPLQQMQIKMIGLPDADGSVSSELSDATDVVGQYGLASNPLSGAEAVYASVGGVRLGGVIIAIADRRYRMTGLKSGEVALHDDLGHQVYLTRDGIVIKGAGQQIVFTDTPSIRMECDLQVTGDVLDQCDDAGKTMASMRQVHDEHIHSTPAGDSGVPKQQE